MGAYRAELGEGRIPEGTQVSGSVVFDVPSGATGFALAFLGSDPVDLRAAPGVLPTVKPSKPARSGGQHH